MAAESISHYKEFLIILGAAGLVIPIAVITSIRSPAYHGRKIPSDSKLIWIPSAKIPNITNDRQRLCKRELAAQKRRLMVQFINSNVAL